MSHAAFDCAPNGWEYCEYRDGAGENDWGDFTGIGSMRQRPRAYITINATTGGLWLVFRDAASHRLIHAKADGAVQALQRYQVDAGKTRKIEIRVYGRGNYRKDGNGSGTVLVAPPGSSGEGDAIASCTITVQDDDNTAYIGSRYYHPYGGVWQSEPHCYDEVGCASRQ